MCHWTPSLEALVLELLKEVYKRQVAIELSSYRIHRPSGLLSFQEAALARGWKTVIVGSA